MALPRIEFGDSKTKTIALELSDDMVFIEIYKGKPTAVYMPKKHFEELRADITYGSPLPKPTISDENHQHIQEIVTGKFQAAGAKIQKAFSALDAFKAPKISGLTLRKTTAPLSIESPPECSVESATITSEKVGFEVNPPVPQEDLSKQES
jgi:hypothetical protein